jgi:hypothetical protein
VEEGVQNQGGGRIQERMQENTNKQHWKPVIRHEARNKTRREEQQERQGMDTTAELEKQGGRFVVRKTMVRREDRKERMDDRGQTSKVGDNFEMGERTLGWQVRGIRVGRGDPRVAQEVVGFRQEGGSPIWWPRETMCSTRAVPGQASPRPYERS